MIRDGGAETYVLLNPRKPWAKLLPPVTHTVLAAGCVAQEHLQWSLISVLNGSNGYF